MYTYFTFALTSKSELLCYITDYMRSTFVVLVVLLFFTDVTCCLPSIDDIQVMMIVWRITAKISRTVLCCIECHKLYSYEQFLQVN